MKGTSLFGHLILEPSGVILPVLCLTGPTWRWVAAFDGRGVRRDRIVNGFMHQAKTAVGEVLVIHAEDFRH